MYSYGIEICKQVLLELSTERELKDRVAKAFSEIDVIKYSDTYSDVWQQHFTKIQTLKEKYLSMSETILSVSRDGTLSDDTEKELKEFGRKLVELCVEIIEHNARNKYNLRNRKKRG